jgi:MOSC domain-containing protein YiiM
MTTFRIREVRVGRPQRFGPQGQLSAIDKAPVSGPIAVTASGLVGDEQADRRHHGGPDKAVHVYAAAHFPAWAKDLPEAADRFRPGAFRENLVIEDATEADICLGDRWQLGALLLEVSQGRQPCWKLNLRFGIPDMARRVQDSGRTGWYFRVIEPGTVAAGDEVRLAARPNSAWPLVRVTQVLYRNALDLESLAELAALPCLPEGWSHLARRRIETGTVEDWRARTDPRSPTSEIYRREKLAPLYEIAEVLNREWWPEIQKHCKTDLRLGEADSQQIRLVYVSELKQGDTRS